ncbi:Uncharacterized protein Adt_20579 [Abeliophyllum distichum]|uniref:LAGLIDADG homing endonuclease n=1 Tax=Abeliophyllum distichum TaxID=126358 RepID=A0ABD1SX11_9LAMI
MNEKYESIVAILAKMSASKDKQIEGANSSSNYKGLNVSMRSGGDGRMGRGTYDVRMKTKLPEIYFPWFGGENPREWVRKANKYFQIHQIPEELKIEIAKMYLKSRANI